MGTQGVNFQNFGGLLPGDSPPGLPGSSPPPQSGGNASALNGDQGDWSNSLLPMSLANVGSQPVSFCGYAFKEEQSNALAIHTYPNLDSARIENMGRNPAVFHVRAAMTNNIYPATIDKWVAGLQFPTNFGYLYNVLLNTTTDKLFNHPIYGLFTVQVKSWSYELNTKGPRDGVIVDMELIETIGQNNPLLSFIPGSDGGGLAQAGTALDNAITEAPGTLALPALSIGQLFGQISSTIRSVLSFPQNVVAAIAMPINQTITGVDSVGSAFISAPANTYNSTSFTIQATKNSLQFASIQNAVSYDQSTFGATQAIVALNNQTSQNAYQFIGKVQNAVSALIVFYTNQNTSLASPIIEALYQFQFQLQQALSALTQNASNQAVGVSIYITNSNMTWQMLSNYLNNQVGDLLGLNQALANQLWVPQNTQINYFQAQNQ